MVATQASIARSEPDGLVDLLSVRARWLLPSLLIVAALAITYGQVARFELLAWDDPVNITHNRLLHPPSLAHVAQFWRAPYAGLYVPVTYTFWSLEARLAATSRTSTGLNPGVFHLGNLLLHALATLAVFGALRQLVQNDWPACGGALLFGLHPLQVESVAWITETKGLLCGLFSFVALWAYLRFARAERLMDGRWRWYALATLSLVLALLSKPSAAAVPAMAFVLDVGVLGRRWSTSLRALAPWLALACGPLLATKLLQPDELLVDVPSLWQRPLVAADAILFYGWKLVWPVPLGPDYGRSPRVALSTPWPWVALFALLLGALVLVVRRAWKSLTVVALLAVAPLPVLGLVPFAYQQFSTVADRYAYLATFAPALAAAWLLSRHQNRAVTIGAAVLLVALAWTSHVQAASWRDSESLYRLAVSTNPRSLLAHNGLGNLLAEQGRWQEAAGHYQAAVDADPTSYAAHYNLGRALARLGKRPELISQALDELNASLRLRPGYGKAHFELARLYAEMGRLAESKHHLLLLTRVEPDRFDAWFSLGEVNEALRQPQEAVVAFQQAIKLNPRSAPAHERVARLFERQGDKERAKNHYRQALAIDARSAAAREALARLNAD
jgi:tetratricopeptide (TPR) repeat protein